MRVHTIQHVSFEGPAAVADWASARGHSITSAISATEPHPPAEEVDLLVVMGGPMGATSEAEHPWLAAEKRFIAEAIAGGRLVLGICLGAQILAEVLGGTVRANPHPEIGWYPLHLTTSGASEPLFANWDDRPVVGHWHADTFELPLGMEPVLSSEACRNQAFVFDGRVVGLQFHVEWTPMALADLVARCSGDLAVGGPYVMTAAELAEGAEKWLPACRERLFGLLDEMAAAGPGTAGEGST